MMSVFPFFWNRVHAVTGSTAAAQRAAPADRLLAPTAKPSKSLRSGCGRSGMKLRQESKEKNQSSHRAKRRSGSGSANEECRKSLGGAGIGELI